MPKKHKGDAMRDNFLSASAADTPHSISNASVSGDDVVVSKMGMRHSIRPRRIVAEQVRDREVGQSTATPYEAQFVPMADTARWFDLNTQEPGADRARSSAMPVVDADRDSSSARSFDLLRTRLRQTTQEHGWTNIAVTSPTSGCGNTFTAVNLALSLSRIAGSRTVLMDFNMRNPGVAAAFDIQTQGDLTDYLDGTVAMADHIVRCSDTLALGLNANPHADAAEMLLDPATRRTLEHMQSALQPEIVIYDMPPMLAYDDVSAFLPQLDGVLLVSDGTQTTARQLAECERMLDGNVPLLGVVLNRARRSSVSRYN
jgi:Mrp family chromosome partitioning ATPase